MPLGAGLFSWRQGIPGIPELCQREGQAVQLGLLQPGLACPDPLKCHSRLLLTDLTASCPQENTSCASSCSPRQFHPMNPLVRRNGSDIPPDEQLGPIPHSCQSVGSSKGEGSPSAGSPLNPCSWQQLLLHLFSCNTKGFPSSL